MSRVGARCAAAIGAMIAAAGLAVVPHAVAGGVVGAAGEWPELVCPEVALVVARGSEQNGPDYVIPTRFSEQAGWVSDGYEGRNIRALLQLAEDRSLSLTGASMLADVALINLGPAVYPAAFPAPALTAEGEEISEEEFVRRLGDLVTRTPLPVILGNLGAAFAESVRAGIVNTPGALEHWEQTTGCRPDYILIGYSQGALVLAPQEQALARAGRLRGVIYLGNGLLHAGDPGIITDGGPIAGGVLRGLTIPQARPASGVPRVEYCVAADFICNGELATVQGASDEELHAHSFYFLTDRYLDTDAQVADALRQMVGETVAAPGK